MKPIQVGLLGAGAVGSGMFEVLQRNQEEIRRRAGREIAITHIADLDLARARAVAGGSAEVGSDAHALIASPEIDVVDRADRRNHGVARTLVLEAIDAGKHVVTANKALLAVHGTEIFAAARENGVMVAFEAAVAGGIPIIKALREGLTANRIEWIAGIINGTTNFILSEMRDKRHRLRRRARRGAAARLCRGRPDASTSKASTPRTRRRSSAQSRSASRCSSPRRTSKGSRELQAADIAYAEQLGYRIKLLAITKRRTSGAQRAEGIELRVHPTLVPAQVA